MTNLRISKSEFEQHYAELSGLTVKELRRLGRYAKRCDCGQSDCLGWKMVAKGYEESYD